MNDNINTQNIAAVTTQPAPEWILYAFGLFLIFIIAMIWDTKRRWNRLSDPFKTLIKLAHNETYDQQIVLIDGRTFKNLVVAPTEDGLYISHAGIFPHIFLIKPVLIPWQSLSDFYEKKRLVFGVTVSEYFTDTRSPSGRVQLRIPANIAEEAIRRGFIKKKD